MMLLLCASSCCNLKPNATASSPVILGDATQKWYPANTPVAVPAAGNTNGLYVLTPNDLYHLMRR